MNFPISKKIKYSDLRVISDLFLPNSELHIFDPYLKVTFDVNEKDIKENSDTVPTKRILFNFGDIHFFYIYLFTSRFCESEVR